MSLKDKFAKNSNKVLEKTSVEDTKNEIESSNFEFALLEEKNRFIPQIDFEEPANFAKFGSAEKYYYDSISSVYTSYPYDGSLYEKLKWQNSNSNITNYVFENLYPRNNGYINMGFDYGTITSTVSDYSLTSNQEYIYVKGGPNASEEQTLRKKFDKANKLDLSLNRGYNLYINGDVGFTTEFWFKKNDSSGSSRQVIFDLWNNKQVNTSSNSEYGRFRIEFSTSSLDKFHITVQSGSTGVLNAEIGNNLDLANSTWNHYALNVINSGSSLKFDLYKNGELNSSVLTGSSVSEVTGAYLATIGSLITKHTSGSLTDLGYGKLSGSLDEFRFWKTRRNDKKIKRYWFTQVGGGTNTDDANTDLGLYFKFNEGIYDSSNVSVYDKKVIDYSGRVSNGTWTGYKVGSRSIESAMVLAGALEEEFKDPILYSTHPDVVSLMEEKIKSGSYYDRENNAALINSFPEWKLEEDAEQLKNLTQIISEYFDELYLKIKFLPQIHNTVFSSNVVKPNNFAPRLLESHGFNVADIFTDSTILETFLSRNEKQIYVDKIYNIKNYIYQNIYNNLIYIYRSKGTEKSIRNFLRCYGVDDNLIKINLYSNQATFLLEDRYNFTYAKKKYIDLNNFDRFGGTVYQTSSISNANTLSYIPGNIENKNTGITMQAEVLFPKKHEIESAFYVPRIFPKVSLFGVHTANTSLPNDYTWFGSDPASFQVYCNTSEIDQDLCYFSLSSSFLGINLTSSVYREVYNRKKWNFSVRMYGDKLNLTNKLQNLSQSYILEFCGHNTHLNEIENEFKLTASIDASLAEQYFSSGKRIYVGAHRQNFTGSLLESSDVSISSVRYWLSKLSDKTLAEHSKDPLNYGTENPLENITSDSSNYIPAEQTLVLHWDFENVTGSDNGSGIGPSNTTDAKFYVEDLTSGSIAQTKYGWVGNINKYQYIGSGDFFLRNDTSIVRREILNAARRRQAETLNNSDMINILNQQDDITFTRDTEPVNHYFTVEKSFYSVISDEMIKMFGSFISLNNLIGEPAERYRQEYRKLSNLRNVFFDKIENDVDLDRYMEFFKWFDSSIGDMIEQLIPLSANFSNTLFTVVESHMLERNKYWNKYPTLELKVEPPIDAVNGINELKYNWRLGSAPVSGLQSENCLWWKERAERSGSLNPNRQKILDSSLQALNRKFNTVYDFNVKQITIMDSRPNRTDFVKAAVKFSSNSYLSISADEIFTDTDCNDE
jgi:hypothetical protein